MLLDGVVRRMSCYLFLPQICKTILCNKNRTWNNTEFREYQNTLKRKPTGAALHFDFSEKGLLKVLTSSVTNLRRKHFVEMNFFCSQMLIRDLAKVGCICCIQKNESGRTVISPWLLSTATLVLYSINVLLPSLTIISTGYCLTTRPWTSLSQTFVGRTLVSGLALC